MAIAEEVSFRTLILTIFLFSIACDKPNKFRLKSNSINFKECDSIIIDSKKSEYILVGDLGVLFYSKIISTKNAYGKTYTETFKHNYIENIVEFVEKSKECDTLNYSCNILKSKKDFFAFNFYPNGKLADFVKDVDDISLNSVKTEEVQIYFDSLGKVYHFTNIGNNICKIDSIKLNKYYPDWIEQVKEWEIKNGKKFGIQSQ